jgi:BirA family biotin operon repressor/biotin-[acetyl-CoA-carboxylase] ligase
METLFIGRQRFEEEELLSTNQYALDLVRKGLLKEGAIILAGKQAAGRGQRGSSWESEPGKNITVSVVLMPAFLDPVKQFELTQISALAVAGCVEIMLGSGIEKTQIKWPNDVLAGEKKIAGILIENVIRDNKIVASMIGIGLNVNQELFLTTSAATSLKLLSGFDADKEKVLEKLCGNLEARYLQLMAGKNEFIHTSYLERLYRLNEWHLFSSGEKNFSGMITGVSAQGKLQMDTLPGGKKEFDLKEISYLMK